MTLPQFDTTHFTALVRSLAKSAFRDILSQASDEHVYAFGLYTNGEGGYVIPTANTEEALERTALVYAQTNATPVDLHRQSLRWSPCDWQYHEEGGDAAFEEVDRYLETGWNADYTHFRFNVELVERCCITALQQLQQEYFFRVPGNQKPVLVNVFKGDQSDKERMAFAQELNNEVLCRQFQQELEQGYKAFFAIADLKRGD